MVSVYRKFQIIRIWPLVLAALLAACAAPATLVPTMAAMPTAMETGPNALSVAVASNDFGTGSPRVPFVLFKGAQAIADARSVTVAAYDLASGTPAQGWTGAAVGYNDYDIPYWVVYPELPHAGFWGLGVIVTAADNSQQTAQFTVEVLADPSAPQIGEKPPASRNRTLSTEPDLARLTSDTAPEPALYQLTVAQALDSGKPTVVTFATPAFCTSRLCTPVVNSVKTVFHSVGAAANFIHIEVYKTFDPLVYADEMDEWHLQGEPFTFVIGRDGKVAALLGGPLSPRELDQALEPLLKP